MNHISFNLIGIFVNDLRTMVDFYHRVIGIDIEWDGEGPYAEFKHEGVRFAMYERRMLPDYSVSLHRFHRESTVASSLL